MGTISRSSCELGMACELQSVFLKGAHPETLMQKLGGLLLAHVRTVPLPE